MRDEEYEVYLDTEESMMKEEFDESKSVSWRPRAWADRDKDAYSTVAVLPGCVVFEENVESVLGDFAHAVGAKHPLLIIGTAVTRPDMEEQDTLAPETGGRFDFFFSFNDLDIPRVAIPRLAYGVRWWEDVVDNEWNAMHLDAKQEYKEHSIYPEYVFDSIGFGSGVYG